MVVVTSPLLVAPVTSVVGTVVVFNVADALAMALLMLCTAPEVIVVVTVTVTVFEVYTMALADVKIVVVLEVTRCGCFDGIFATAV